MANQCPICNSLDLTHVVTVKGYDYFQCLRCETIFISPVILAEMDNGKSLVEYREEYWNMEVQEAKERAYSIALARMAEVIYYARIPINRFLDIGTGPGFFLDAIEKYLPSKTKIFYGVEKFPPPASFRSQSNNYIIGTPISVGFKVEAGMCIEVIEHLTPNMLRKLLEEIAFISEKGAIYIINSGLPEFVLKDNLNYLDPTVRGHIVSYSVKAVNLIANELGFLAYAIPGKRWAFILEFRPADKDRRMELTDRIWKALPENLDIMIDDNMGGVLKLLGLETCRAYGN